MGVSSAALGVGFGRRMRAGSDSGAGAKSAVGTGVKVPAAGTGGKVGVDDVCAVVGSIVVSSSVEVRVSPLASPGCVSSDKRLSDLLSAFVTLAKSFGRVLKSASYV